MTPTYAPSDFRNKRVKTSRNISPSPHRPDQARLYFDSAFLADRGVKLPPSSVISRDTAKVA